jgi:hypothetical protein
MIAQVCHPNYAGRIKSVSQFRQKKMQDSIPKITKANKIGNVAKEVGQLPKNPASPSSKITFVYRPILWLHDFGLRKYREL